MMNFLVIKNIKIINWLIINQNVLIIDGNKEYNPIDIALCILKWVNVSNNINCNIYNSLFTSFYKKIELIKKNFSLK